jgi:glycine/D-amino acid oxidase-like deaminating enzyme
MPQFMQQPMQEPLPQHVDVAVIGGGIIGIGTALALARAGVRVAVFEKGTVAGEQSSRNWGWVRTVGRDPKELELALLANEMWSDIQSKTEVGYRRTGLAYLAQSDAEMARHQQWLDSARTSGVRVSLIGKGELAQHIPASNRPWVGALYSASDGVAEPALATRAIAKLAIEAGAQVFEQCAVRGIETAAGAVSAVVTERGVVKCAAAVLAGGAWSRLFCGNHAIELPQLKVHASVLSTTPLQTGLDMAVNGVDFTCRKRSDGGYTVSQLGASVADLTPDSLRLCRAFLPAWMAERKYLKLRMGRRFFEELRMPRRFGLDQPTPFEACRQWDPAPSMPMVERALEKLKHAFPAFKEARIARAWAGMIDVTPDALPVISAVPRVAGFFVGTGFSGHGFGIGPAAGAALADLVTGARSRVDLKPFVLERFAA